MKIVKFSLLLTILPMMTHGMGINWQEMRQLMQMVNPQSCGCQSVDFCEVPIHNAHAVGFRYEMLIDKILNNIPTHD